MMNNNGKIYQLAQNSAAQKATLEGIQRDIDNIHRELQKMNQNIITLGEEVAVMKVKLFFITIIVSCIFNVAFFVGFKFTKPLIDLLIVK